ncbi:hypothetical protein MMC12_005829 [Toensbergia leucococca]|nr:hypothetical protein [Toensbergia leucococca]
MPQIEVLPNSTSMSAPGWAYVPDTGYDPSKAAIQPSGARKRAARSSAFAGGDTSIRQQNAVLKHLAELDKDNHRDAQISLSAKGKDTAARSSKSKITPNVRRILISQKTFANHLADEEAAIAAQVQPAPGLSTPRSLVPKVKPPSVQQKRSSLSEKISTPLVASTTSITIASTRSPLDVVPPSLEKESDVVDPLLKSYVPSAPSEATMEALLSAPPLSYNGARAAPPSSGKPPRHFCEICGYWGTIKCMKCGARVCGLECKTTHDEGRCLKFYA